MEDDEGRASQWGSEYALENCAATCTQQPCDGILQGSVEMAPAPAPEDELERILALERTRRVDLTAFIADMSPTRRETTAYGQQDIVGVAFVDGSKQAGRQEQVNAQLAMFFETSANGAAELKSLRDVHASNTVVAVYGLTCIPREKGSASSKLARRSFGK